MTPQSFYSLSEKSGNIAHILKGATKRLFDFHLVRYKYFVDGSSVGHNCTFATACKQISEEDVELDKIEQYLEETLQAVSGALSEFKRLRRTYQQAR